MNAIDPDCDNCRRAAAGMWICYRMACDGCTARAIARSMAAFNAARPGASADDKAALRETYARALPHLPMREAHEAMLFWWRLDHAVELQA